MKIPLLTVLLVSAIAGLATYWQSSGEDEDFILPGNFRGAVIVLFAQKSGAPPKYLDGKRIYEIPNDGILRTQFSVNDGWHRPWRFFYRRNQELVGVEYSDQSSNKAEEIRACCISTGNTSHNPKSTEVSFMQFFVGTVTDIDAAKEKLAKTNISDLVQE